MVVVVVEVRLSAILSRLLFRKLGEHDLPIDLTGLHKLLMGAMSHQLAPLQHQDLIGMHDGRYTLRHDQDCAVFGFRCQCPAQFQIGAEVQRRKAVVKQIELRTPDNGTGNGEPLLLSAREVLSSLLDGGIISADLIEDKLLRLGNPGGVCSTCSRVALSRP